MQESSVLKRLASKLLHSINTWMQKLSLPSLYRIGNVVGHLLWYLLPKRRKATIKRIQVHLPQIDTAEKATTFAHRSMCENGCSFLEIFAIQRFATHSINDQMHIAEPEEYKNLTTSPRPVVAVTAHLGSWELMAGLLGTIFSQEHPCAVVVRKQSFEPLQQIIAQQRAATGAQVINHNNAAPHVLRVLKKNGVVAFLADHNAMRSEAIFLPFLHQTAAINKGPALLAIRAKAIIWPACLVRTYGESYSHTFHTYPPLDTTTLEGSVEEQITTTSIFITKAMEQMVLAYPEQWFWMHNRWKTQPRKIATDK